MAQILSVLKAVLPWVVSHWAAIGAVLAALLSIASGNANGVAALLQAIVVLFGGVAIIQAKASADTARKDAATAVAAAAPPKR